MIKQGMNLTKEQRGEAGEESKMESTSTSSQLSDDKKSTVQSDDKKSLQVCAVLNHPLHFRVL